MKELKEKMMCDICNKKAIYLGMFEEGDEDVQILSLCRKCWMIQKLKTRLVKGGKLSNEVHDLREE